MESSSELRELDLLDLLLISRMKIALELDYPSLRAFCETSKAIRLVVCSDPFFWKKKTYYDFGDFYDIEERSGDWRRNYEYYRDLFSYDLIHDIASDDQDKIYEKLFANEERKFLNANRQGINGQTALMRAVEQRYPILVEELLEVGANPNLRNNDGLTALMYASMVGEENIFQTLLEYGADINVKNDVNDTALSLVCDEFVGEDMEEEGGRATNIVRMLLERGVSDVDAGRQSWTPLMTATIRGYSEVVKMLLEAGADPNLENYDGLTALDLAYETSSPEIVKILEEVTPFAGSKVVFV